MITEQQNSINSDYHLQLIVDCAQGQSILIGKNIAIKINYTYLRKRDKKSCVNLLIEAPVDLPIFQTCVNRHAPKVTPTEDTLESMEDFLNADNDIKQAASSAAQAGTDSAHGVNTAQTQCVQGLSAQNALEASSASNASDAVTGKSDRAGKLSSSETLTTPQGNHPTLTVKPARSTAAKINAAALCSGTPTKDTFLNSVLSSATLHDVRDVNHSPFTSPFPLSHSNGRIVSHDNTLSKAMATSQDALPETLPDVVTEPLQATTKKPRTSRKKSAVAHVTAEVLA